MNKTVFSFEDKDPQKQEIKGDLILKLGGADPSGATHYVVYWSGSPGKAGKGSRLAQVSVPISGNLLYKVPENTKIPASKSSHFLLYLKDAQGEIYGGKSVKVVDYIVQPKAEKPKVKPKPKPKPVPVAPPKPEPAAPPKPEVVLPRVEAMVPMPKPEPVEVEQITVRVVKVENVLFEFDRSELRENFKTELESSFADVEEKDAIKIKIAGHADERGSNEYNLALGERRAFAVKQYLISLGLLEENIEIISFGEEKPVDPRHTEEAWEKNRRAESDIVD